ncbi:MAG: alpha-amylase family glycosyl hydrolase [Candidatus Cloacimonadota bacterium]|nr:alpha-amylase family glycosyl hydrolase [Candidatus Cloacimonadota bacterium]
MVLLDMKKSLLICRKAQKEYALPANPKLEIDKRSDLHEIISGINKKKNMENTPPYKASELNSLMLLNLVFQKIISLYEKDDSFSKFFEFAQKKLPLNEFLSFLQKFKQVFGLKHYKPQNLIPEILINWLLNTNKAAEKYRELFSNAALRYSVYEEFLQLLNSYFQTNSHPIHNSYSLTEFLQLPLLKYPDSLEKQLEYIRDNWAKYLDNDFGELLSALDFVKEENKLGLTGPAPREVYEFNDEDDYERFSEDSNWMPKLVMIAKNSYVWLDQLSKKYKKNITKLNQIPETELELLSKYGFTGIWLIGIWERSPASKKIKHLVGNEDAIASAYSLYDYTIATDLGGETALDELIHKAWKYGIRLGCDMVPNHVGIDSKWIYQHPDWFIQTDRSPFPNYTFSKLNLSSHPDYEIYLEEHYFDRTDAAVVFQMHDHVHQKTRYIYHGNDGTSFPWNDTAQLNYLLPEVRRTVIDKIKKIARKFPIIRFDAAMTLAKKHFQRLWYPQPGTGGDIPSRSEFSMTKTEFNRYMPQEFWRQAVDEINSELPDTLLLAEAFWMMEGYFVRTLGMHRVYNSAFMNMLKNEENDKYQQSIVNVLKFNPQILKRFVNFMSNPDEETAIAQFGTDDKYFGVCVLMSTLPGLPMFAHGQIEGFQERYGMEYARPKWQEKVNEELLHRHQQEIFPIIKKRYLFANVEHFRLFSFETDSENICKDVFAYTNSSGDETAIVIYHNRYAEIKGRIHSGFHHYKKKSVKLADILQIPNRDDNFVILYDLAHKLEYIFNCAEIHQHGLAVKLQAFEYHVFLKSRVIKDNNLYHKAWQHLQGQGTANIDHFVVKLRLQPLLHSFSELLKKEELINIIYSKDYEASSNYIKQVFRNKLKKFLENYHKFVDSEKKITNIRKKIKKELLYTVKVSNYINCKDLISLKLSPMLINMLKKIGTPPGLKIIRFYWIILHNLNTNNTDAINLLEDYHLRDIILEKLDKNQFNSYELLEFLRIGLLHENLHEKLTQKSNREIMEDLLVDPRIRNFLQLNSYNNILWFNKERFQYFLQIIFSTNWFNLSFRKQHQKAKDFENFIIKMWQAMLDSQFKVNTLLNNLGKENKVGK